MNTGPRLLFKALECLLRYCFSVSSPINGNRRRIYEYSVRSICLSVSHVLAGDIRLCTDCLLSLSYSQLTVSLYSTWSCFFLTKASFVQISFQIFYHPEPIHYNKHKYICGIYCVGMTSQLLPDGFFSYGLVPQLPFWADFVKYVY